MRQSRHAPLSSWQVAITVGIFCLITIAARAWVVDFWGR